MLRPIWVFLYYFTCFLSSQGVIAVKAPLPMFCPAITFSVSHQRFSQQNVFFFNISIYHNYKNWENSCANWMLRLLLILASCVSSSTYILLLFWLHLDLYIFRALYSVVFHEQSSSAKSDNQIFSYFLHHDLLVNEMKGEKHLTLVLKCFNFPPTLLIVPHFSPWPIS